MSGDGDYLVVGHREIQSYDFTFERGASGYRQIHLKVIVADLDEFRVRFGAFTPDPEFSQIYVDSNGIHFDGDTLAGRFAFEPVDLGDLLACPLRGVVLTPSSDPNRPKCEAWPWSCQ